MSKKVLLVDDSVTIQKVVSITFTSEDFDLSTVSDSASAISKAKELKPDLMLLDISLPEKNGYQLCEEIKQNPELKDVPVLMLAGTFEPYDEAEGNRVGADDYIVKPFESQDLIDKVKALLDRKETGELPKEDEAASEGKDVWDVADIGDFLEVEKGAMTPEEGIGETMDSPREEAVEPPQPSEEEGIEDVSKEDIEVPTEDEIVTPETGIEEIEEPFLHVEQEGVGEVSEEDIGEGAEDKEETGVKVSEEDLELIEDVETFEEIEPLEVGEEPLEEATEDQFSVQPVHEDVIEKKEPLLEETSVQETTGDDEALAEGVEFEEIVSEDAAGTEGEEEKEVELSTEVVPELPSPDEVLEEETMFKEDISKGAASEEVGDEVVEEDMHGMPEEKEIIPEPVSEEDEASQREIEVPASISEDIVEKKVKEKIEESITQEKIDELLGKAIKEVVGEVTWEVAPGLIEDIIKAEVKKVKEAIVRVKDAFTSEQ